MFEYDGDQYTEQEIIDAASKAGLSFEDYTSKHGIIAVVQEGKTNATAEETAPVVAETPADTDLQLENGSLDFPGKVVRIKRKDAARGYDEYSYAEIQQKIQDPNFRKGQKRFENVEAYVDAFGGQAQIVDLGAEQVGDLKDSSEREATEAVKFEDGPSVPVSDFEQEVEVVQGFEEVNKLNFEAENNIVENYADIDAYNEIGSKSVGEINFELPKQELDKSIQDKYTAGFGEDKFIKTFDSQVLNIKQEDIDKKGGEILSKYKFNKETGEFPDKDSERKALEEFEEYQTNLIQNARENSVGYQSRIKAYKNAFVNEIEKQNTKFDEIKAQELSDKTVQEVLPPVARDVLNFIGIDTAVARTVLEATKSATMGLPAVGGMDKMQSLGVLRDAHQSLRARANNQNTFEGEDTVINGVAVSEYTPIRVKNPLYTQWKNSDPDTRDINPPREFSFTLIDTEKQRQAGQYVEGGNKRFKTIHGSGIVNYFDTEFEAETFFSKRMGETADDVYKLFDLKSDFDGMLSKIKAAPEFTNEKGEYDSSKFTYENLRDAIGTTATQMLMARLTLGLSSYSQETGNMFEQVLEGKAVEKYGEEFLALSEDKKLEKYLQLTKDGEINYNDIRISGTQIASLDLFGSATALNQVPKIDGSIIRNLMKSNWKGAVKEGKNVAKNALKGGLTEVPTESAQELISGREVNKQLYGMEGAYVTDEQIRSVKEVGFQSLIGVSGTVASGNTAARGIRHLKRKLATGNNRAILNDAKAALGDVDLVYESSVNQVNKKLKEGSLSKFEADAELRRLKNSRDNQITALYKAQEVATGSKYKNYEPEAREEALNLIVDNLYLNEKVSDIDADAEKAKATGFYSEDDFDGRKQAIKDKMVDNEIERQIIDAKQNYLYAGSQMREFINNNPDKFNNARAVAFETRQEAEEYFKTKFGKDFKPEGRYKQLLDGDVFGFYDPDKNLIIDVKENLFNQGNGNRELQLRNARIASNVVYHEGGHALMSTLEDSELASIKEGLEDFMANSLDPKIISVYNSVKQREANQKNKKKRIVNEEFIASVSDALREYDIAKGDVATQAGLSKLGTLINGKLSTAAPAGLSFKGLESGTQTLEFIKKYNTFTGTVDPQFSEGRTVTPSGEEKDTTVSEEQVASEIVGEVRFEDDSINEQFKAFAYDGKVNNAPESFHAMAAYQYEPLAQAVVNTLANKGIVSGSAEQNNLIMGYLEDATNRQELVEQLVIPVGGNQASSLLGLAKTYNPEIGSFGGYAKGFLAARAIRQLENKMKASFIGSQKIDSPESKEIEAGEQQIEITQPVVERLKLNDKISEDLNKLGEMAIIQAEKAITSKDLSDLKKVNLRNKTFGDIFAKRLFNDVKNVLGKNTKTKSDFTDFLNNNYDALSDIALNYIDFQKGSGPASVWSLDSPPTREEFIEYYEAKDEKTSTRGDRKKSLNNAIARAISNDVRNKMVDDNPSINEGFEKVAGIPLASEVLYDLPLQEKKDWFVTLKDAEVDLKGVKISSLSTEAEIDALIDYYEQHVWSHIPKGLFIWSEADTGNVLNKNVGAGIISKAGALNQPILDEKGNPQMVKRGSVMKPNKPRYELAKYMAEQTKIRANAFKNWGDDILLDGKPIEKYRNDHYSKTVQKPLENIAAAYKNGKSPSQSDIDVVVAFNRKNRAIGEEVYKRFNKAIKDDKQNAIGIAAFLKLAGNDTEHFNRQLAEVVGISHTPEGRGKTYEWEHAMQQVHVGKTLLAAMLDKDRNFDAEFAAIMNNFKLIGLDNKHNHMLNKTGYKNSMGKGWDVFKSSWLSRYFNDQVAEIGGIPPNSLVGLDGRTFDEIYNVDVNGNSTKALASEKLSDEFNQMLERVKGVKAEARYSQDRANKLAGNKGKFKFFVPYSAEDYLGLVYPTLGKGKEGDRNLQWYKDNIVNPFAIGIANYEKAKVESLQQWRNLKKQVSKTPAKLNKEATRGFTNEEAVRVYLWNEQNVVPDTLAKKDVEALVKHVEDSKDLTAFAENVKGIVGIEGYPPPNENWISGSLTIDLIDNINTTKRSEFLQQWQDNVDGVYSKDNMNKLKAIYGERYTEALENILHRMKTGRNRPSGATRLENQFMNWINDSVGTVMFFNTRSALLQTISSVNFLNWSDNNPLMAGKAFANQPQFWKDFSDLFNSDFLKSRRSGLKNDINADELAKSAASSDNKVRAALSSLLKAGFLPTQIADSFAISIGGASFYRNRYNTYKKDGLSDQEAKDKAMLDFQETAEESQQSSRPDRVSMQQASSLGRVILAFANTPMQYTRLTKKAALDLVNGRGDWKTNMSKILYYGAVQNIIFTALQQAMFAMLFDDDEIDDEEQTEASTKIVNGIADTFLRGSGVGGAAVATMKNIIMEIIKQKESKRPDYTKAALKLTTLSPPVDTKIRKLMSAGRAFTYKQSLKDMNRLGIDIDNPAALATGQVLSAVANLPADRAILKMQNVKGALDTEHEAWQRIAMGLGFADWQLGIDKDKSSGKRLVKSKRLSKRKGKTRRKSPAKRLERGVAGKAYNDGSIEVDPNLSPVEREKTIVHEKQHIKDMNAGKLNYDDNYVYWNGSKYQRKNGKIKYKGKSYEEGHKKLPWEKRAYDAEPTTKEIKKRQKLY